MASRAPDASKVAFATLLANLLAWRFELVDCQSYTEHLARFGAVDWPRSRFLRVLKKAKPERSSVREAKEALDATDDALFEKLRARRLELAKAQNVPPYVIFHDRTLMEMAARCPRSSADLRAIAGVGEAKLARYGEAFLEVINGHEATQRHSP